MIKNKGIKCTVKEVVSGEKDSRPLYPDTDVVDAWSWSFMYNEDNPLDLIQNIDRLGSKSQFKVVFN